jgi:hypothetical protein
MNLLGGAILGGWTRSPNMARFDGSDYLRRASGLTGAADGKQFTLSFWIGDNYDNSVSRSVFSLGDASSSSSGVYVRLVKSSTSFKIQVTDEYSSFSTLKGESTSTVATGSRRHIMIAIDKTSTAKRKVYIDGSPHTMTWTDYDNVNLFLTGQCYVGNAAQVSSPFSGDFYDVWYDDAYYDPATYISSFYNAGVPVNLGSHGQKPTGNSPLIYLNGYNKFTNRGTGGDFTLTGALTQGASI